MLTTHTDAIETLQNAGIPASRRSWALGDTIVVPLGRPSARDGITTHPSALWLIPSASGWRLEQPVTQLPRNEAFADLDAACQRAIEIAQAFLLTEPCDTCGRNADLDFGERHETATGSFWVSSRCPHCGAQSESDGTGTLPETLRQLEQRRHGVWAVVVQPPLDAAAQWAAIRRELCLSLPALADLKTRLPGRAFSGTFAEAARLCRSLRNEKVWADLEQAG